MDHVSVDRSVTARAAFLSLFVVVAILLSVVPTIASEEEDWPFEVVVDSRPNVDAATPPARPLGGAMTVDLSLAQFRDLQRLDEEERRSRLGLPPNCVPALTAVMPASSHSNQLVVVVTCSKTP